MKTGCITERDKIIGNQFGIKLLLLKPFLNLTRNFENHTVGPDILAVPNFTLDVRLKRNSPRFNNRTFISEICISNCIEQFLFMHRLNLYFYLLVLSVFIFINLLFIYDSEKYLNDIFTDFNDNNSGTIHSWNNRWKYRIIFINIKQILNLT